jgi:hypothetical protein
MRIILTSITLLSLASAAAASDRPDHFRAKEPANFEAAIAQLEASRQEMAGAVEANDMSKVHHSSYNMEAALDWLSDHMEALEEQVEEIHEASEDKEHANSALQQLTAAD